MTRKGGPRLGADYRVRWAPIARRNTSITITPDLQAALQTYAAIYAETYGVEDPIAELVPAMITSFLESDRSFVRERDARLRGPK